jgi:sterol 3beta-glucosyltransferase
MHFGIFTYGTRGDVQPYIALSLGLMENGHKVTLAAPENFKEFVEGFGIDFHPLFGNVEELMNRPEGQQILKTGNNIKLLKYFYKTLSSYKKPLRASYINGVSKVDAIIANLATMSIVYNIAEQQGKKIAFSYFMPPMAMTTEFPVADFDFFNFPWYNRFTYNLVYSFYWKFLKKETNEFRRELGLPVLKENLLTYIEKQKILDLYLFSPYLIPQPNDWEAHHKITGFLTIPKAKREVHSMDKTPAGLKDWLANGAKPVYFGFGSNGVGDPSKINRILNDILSQTKERILFCTGWAYYPELPNHPNLFIAKYVNHEEVIPKCKVAIFHGGAGTLATMLRNEIPVIIVSFYTDQPTWGKIIQKKKLGIHIPFKKLNSSRLIKAIEDVQTEEILENVSKVGSEIRKEDGLKNAIQTFSKYFEIEAEVVL